MPSRLSRLVPAVLASALVCACTPGPGSGGGAEDGDAAPSGGAGPEDTSSETPSGSDAGCLSLGPGLVPTSGVLAGIHLDWEQELLADYAERLGHRPAVVGSFAPFPMRAQDEVYVTQAQEQVRAQGGILLLTLEPRDGLDAVTDEAASDVARLVDGYQRDGVPVVVRFGHDMNGSWYPWGQQPEAFREAFRVVAEAVHRDAPGSVMMWAPHYGGGYPFARGEFVAAPGSAELKVLDTSGDGALGQDDDPYAPYYPGDDVVDWVGLSLYHWGDAYPWGSNVVPEQGKFVAQLTGDYVGAASDETAVPDFYADYAEARDKPLAVPETAALFRAGRDGADELAIKRAWWTQLADPALQEDLPRLQMISWFEWRKREPEVDAVVDWRVTGSPQMAQQYAADVPEWYVHADGC